MKTAEAQNKQTIGGKRLEGKVVLVTGGSRGIGAGIALRLAEEGATVAITYSKNKNKADDVIAKIKELNLPAAAFQADASSPEQATRVIENVIKEFGKIDILVNNAGVFEGAPLEGTTIEHYQRVFDVNVKGVIANSAAAAKKLSEGGRIINISSVAATSPNANFAVYAASKAALDALTRCWAQELGARKITVNAVSPGTTSSDMYDAALPDEVKKAVPEKTALGRVGEPDDIAAVVAFLASNDGRWVTGQSIVADGGLKF